MLIGFEARLGMVDGEVDGDEDKRVVDVGYSMQPIEGFDPRYARHYTIEILHHDANLLVTNKPHNVRIDGSTKSCPTIESLLQTAFPQYPKFYLIHQLDYVTSGVHCWGLTKRATGKCGRLFQERKVKKRYVAIVHGRLESRIVNAAIAGTSGMKMQIGNVDNPGRESLTYITSMKYGYYGGFEVTLVGLEPYTGRRHQLRVHLASIGHPIVGDVMYEGERGFVAHRCFLHALSLRIGLTKAGLEVGVERINEKRDCKRKGRGEGFHKDDVVVDVESDDPFSQLVRDEPYEVEERREFLADEVAVDDMVYCAAPLTPAPLVIKCALEEFSAEKKSRRCAIM